LIYDLEKMAKDQLMEAESERRKLKFLAEKMEGILRAEVWLTTSKSVQGFTDETIASKHLNSLCKFLPTRQK